MCSWCELLCLQERHVWTFLCCLLPLEPLRTGMRLRMFGAAIIRFSCEDVCGSNCIQSSCTSNTTCTACRGSFRGPNCSEACPSGTGGDQCSTTCFASSHLIFTNIRRHVQCQVSAWHMQCPSNLLGLLSRLLWTQLLDTCGRLHSNLQQSSILPH